MPRGDINRMGPGRKRHVWGFEILYGTDDIRFYLLSFAAVLTTGDLIRG